ncbi:MAG: Holliday junction branch migration DNA helicase RuvB [Parcubacteria group bacterium]|jgi:Holliday junction DNA helicase RuvB|nr:Holliday junction branch migration DNA helicase RuvB [Parcubacteria group bacterium]HRU35838.1 Holliday junction branch migration DNA helicase RuvB [Candidatus Paceibacterota bacterium]
MSKNIFKSDPILDNALRPKSWDNFIGQEKVKINLKIMLEAAEKRHENIDHLLFYGGAGLGKTTLAYLISQEIGANLKITSGPAIEKAADLASLLANLEEGDFLFIDEIHRLNKMIEEVLYSAMESRVLNLVLGKRSSTRTVQLDLPAFTLIGATTRIGLLSSPLRSRFGAIFKLNFYEIEDIKKILKNNAKLLNIKISDEATEVLAKASRATPRVANRLLKRSRDLATIEAKEEIDVKIAQKTLELFDIDEWGLEATDRKILEVIIDNFNGGPVGIKALAAATNEEEDTIEEVYEPYLMQLGLLERTSRGRMVSDAGYKHLNLYNLSKKGEQKKLL